MKIAVSSNEPRLDSQMSPVFGRCFCFAIVEVKNKKIADSKFVENQAVMQPGGAGVMASQTVANEGVKIVITSAMGPRAMGVLQQLGIEFYQGVAGTVQENVQNFIDGKLNKLTTPGPMGIGMGGGMGPGKGMGRGRGMGPGGGAGGGRGSGGGMGRGGM